MVQTNKKLSLLFTVLRQPFYALVSTVTTVGLGLLYYYLTLSIVPLASAVEMIGPLYIVASFGLTFVTAILAGVNMALLIFKIKGSTLIAIKGSSSSTAFGSALAAFTPGCPACTTPLVAVIGTIGGLTIFPLQGLEFKLISILALSFSIYWILKSLQNICRIEKR